MISLEEIGVIRTPYKEKAPFQPDEKKEDCRVEVYERYSKGLYKLDSFRYIYLIYYMHKVSRTSLLAHPPSLKNIEVGVFASRSPFRPNHIAISIVRLKGIENNILFTSNIDALDMTPLLDIKPYFKSLDIKFDANNGYLV